MNFRLEVAGCLPAPSAACPTDVADTHIHLEIDGVCFIATAAYGSSMAPELDVLRAYRDAVLMRSPLGRTLTGCYYRMAPPIARFIADKPWLRAVVRQALAPLIEIVKHQLEQR